MSKKVIETSDGLKLVDTKSGKLAGSVSTAGKKAPKAKEQNHMPSMKVENTTIDYREISEQLKGKLKSDPLSPPTTTTTTPPLHPPTSSFRFRRVDYDYDDGSKTVPAHDFVLENGENKVIGGYTAPTETSPPILFGLHSSQGSRDDVPALLGAIANHCKANYGRLPAVSSDLSGYSYSLANRLESLGIIEIFGDNHKGINKVTYAEAEKAIETILHFTNEGTEGDTAELSRSDYSQGKEAVRALFRK